MRRAKPLFSRQNFGQSGPLCRGARDLARLITVAQHLGGAALAPDPVPCGLPAYLLKPFCHLTKVAPDSCLARSNNNWGGFHGREDLWQSDVLRFARHVVRA